MSGSNNQQQRYPRLFSWIRTNSNNDDNIENDDDDNNNNMTQAAEVDLFDYFDPLLSPHAYPNGISPENAPQQTASTSSSSKSTSSSTTKQKPFGFRLDNSNNNNNKEEKEEVENDSSFFWTDGDTQPATRFAGSSSSSLSQDVFDPLLSPHEYPNGTPDKLIDNNELYMRSSRSASTAARVAILLIDHGSRNQASNARLHDLAKVYQDQFLNTDIVVRAAHMEIASPSIPEALKALLEEYSNSNHHHQLDEIICHPFFLSPLGRHVSEDIPQILEQAQKDLNITIPIIITQPVGAEVTLLMQAIHAQVQQSTTRQLR